MSNAGTIDAANVVVRGPLPRAARPRRSQLVRLNLAGHDDPRADRARALEAAATAST